VNSKRKQVSDLGQGEKTVLPSMK